MAAGFSFSGMTDGEPWAEKWTVDGQELYSSKYDWSSGEKGDTYTCLFNSESGMPEGKYHIELYAGTDLTMMTQSDVVVGGGTSSGPSQPTDQGVVSVSGRILDADSKNPLPGAEIYVLNPGIDFAQWKTNGFADTDIFTSTKADDQGNYALPDKLALDTGYTFVVYADGYKITYGDNLTWTKQDPTDYPMDLTVIAIKI